MLNIKEMKGRYRSWKRKSIVTAGKTWLENPKK